MPISNMLPSALQRLFLKGDKPGFPWKAAGIISGLLLIILTVLGYYIFLTPTHNFAAGSIVTIEKGEGLSEISTNLERSRIVSSRFWFNNLVILQGGEKALVAGDYYFEEPVSMLEIAQRITNGRFGLDPVKITVPEGYTISEMAELFHSKLPKFSKEQFLLLAKSKEGYLFPDTYLFMPTAEAGEVFALMETTFSKKIKAYESQIQDSGRTEMEIITMASILEGEARMSETRKIVSGILWKRLDAGIPLQVDATFRYINGKTTAELTLDDLKIDSPYNTYLYKGLPPTPISNPGLDSIEAALNPTKTKYLYFLTDSEGVMHYAATLPEHVANKNKYLR